MNLDQMAYRCPKAEVIGVVRLEGYRLAFAGGRDYGVATILPETGSHVDGVLWEIGKTDERKLDVYEGFPRLYGKESIAVKDKEGREHPVMVYTMNAPYRDDRALPNDTYLNGIVIGCRQNGIDTGHVLAAFERTMDEIESQREARSKQRARKGPRRAGPER